MIINEKAPDGSNSPLEQLDTWTRAIDEFGNDIEILEEEIDTENENENASSAYLEASELWPGRFETSDVYFKNIIPNKIGTIKSVEHPSPIFLTTITSLPLLVGKGTNINHLIQMFNILFLP